MASIPNAREFLDSIAGYSTAIIKGTQEAPAKPVRLAVIDPAYVDASFPGTLPKVTFEGEDAITVKRYPVISGYSPIHGDRVVMLPVGSTYVIMGKVIA